jgi:predicted PurR-regulated permease PerM
MLVFFGVVLAGIVIYLLRGVLVPLFVAFLVAYALDPAVDRLERLRVPRALGAILVMAATLGLLALVLVLAIPRFLRELAAAGQDLPHQVEALQTRLDPWLWKTFKVHSPHNVADLAKNLAGVGVSNVGAAATTALFGTLTYMGLAVSTLIVPIFSVYLLIDFDRIVRRVADLVPRRYIKGVGRLAKEVHVTLGGWVRGQLTANLVLAALYATGLRIVDIRLAVPIGILTGMLAFIPYIGFGVGLAAALVMSILDWQGIETPLLVVSVMVGVQLIDSLFVTPRIVGRSVGLRPLEVLLTMMAAGTLFGFLGVMLAVPLGAVIKILTQRAVTSYLSSRYYLATR